MNHTYKNLSCVSARYGQGQYINGEWPTEQEKKYSGKGRGGSDRLASHRPLPEQEYFSEIHQVQPVPRIIKKNSTKPTCSSVSFSKVPFKAITSSDK